MRGTSLKAGDEFGARGWIHGSRYTESWNTYSSHSKKLRCDACDALTAGLCDSELEALLAASLSFMPTSALALLQADHT